MSTRFAKGLVVGKFCPLHRGHQLLIDSATRNCDEVVVISYTKPEFERCGRANRDRWVAELFPTVTRLVIDDDELQERCHANGINARSLPHNDASDDEHRDFVAWLCCSLLDTTVDAVFTGEEYGDGFADTLTRYFRVHKESLRHVRHVHVDRETVSVCGTDARSDPYGRRRLLAPVVYSDLVRRVAILGGESTGKTTLAQALASHFGTTWVPEYGRELWELRNGNLQLDDMLKIALEQVDRERRLGREARRWLFCDTTPLTTAFYSQQMFGHVDPTLERLALRDYETIVLCAPDFDFMQDGTRRCAQFRNQQHHWYLRELRNKALGFSVVAGSVPERLSAVVCLLKAAT